MGRPIVILGCGFVGLEVARLALREGLDVIGTTRGASRAPVGPGFDMRTVPELTRPFVVERGRA